MQDRNYDFFKYRKVTSGLSIALVAISALFFGVLWDRLEGWKYDHDKG